MGKSDGLCEEDSDFMQEYRKCTECITKNTNVTTEETTRDYVDPEFAQYLELCAVSYITTTLTHYSNGIPRTGVFLLEASEVSTTSSTTTSTGSSTTSTETSSSTGSSTPPPEDKSSGSRAWIAGPVVGSVVALSLLLGALFWLRQRKRKKATTPVSEPFDESYGKAQLHSDDIPKPVYPTPELHPDSIHEMEGSRPEEAEKPANEAPARELPANETAAQRAGHGEDGGHQQRATN